MTGILRPFIILLQLIVGVPLCLIALLLPYRLRSLYLVMIARLFHSPFILFGRLTKFLCDQLGIDPKGIYE